MAVAADIGDRFGAGEQRLTVNKPLMAAPALPRFLRSGDAASVGIVVHNDTDTAGTATVDREGERRDARPHDADRRRAGERLGARAVRREGVGERARRRSSSRSRWAAETRRRAA